MYVTKIILYIVEYWKCFINEKEKYFKEKQNAIGMNMVDDEKEKIVDICTKIKIDNIYVDFKSDFFFKRSKLY